MRPKSLRKLFWLSTTMTALILVETVGLRRLASAQYYPYPPPSGMLSQTACDSFARDYARSYSQRGGMLRGAAGGAAGGSLFGGIFGGWRGAGTGAAIGAAIGALTGGARRANERRRLYDMAYSDCMQGNIPY